jgi:hypothetical protein
MVWLPQGSVDRLRTRMLAGHEPGDQQQALAVPALMAAVDILEHTAVMKPRVRVLCAQLLTGMVDALLTPACVAAALADPALPQRVAEGILMFLAACCTAACGWVESYFTQPALQC